MDTPVMRNFAWIRAIPLLLAILLAAAALHALQICPECACSFLAAVLLVVGYRYLVRYTITRHYTKGVRLVKAQRYEEAIQAFERNLAFFEKHPNLDRWRSILFLSPGKYGYREATLLGLGFVSGQMVDGRRVEHYHQRALELNPKNGAAIAVLNVLNAGKSMQLDES